MSWHFTKGVEAAEEARFQQVAEIIDKQGYDVFPRQISREESLEAMGFGIRAYLAAMMEEQE